MSEMTLTEALEHIADLERSIEAMRGHGVMCGHNPVVPADWVGCGRPISDARLVYRCTDCDTPFHKWCATKHFRDEHPTRAMEPEDIGLLPNSQ